MLGYRIDKNGNLGLSPSRHSSLKAILGEVFVIMWLTSLKTRLGEFYRGCCCCCYGCGANNDEWWCVYIVSLRAIHSLSQAVADSLREVQGKCMNHFVKYWHPYLLPLESMEATSIPYPTWDLRLVWSQTMKPSKSVSRNGRGKRGPLLVGLGGKQRLIPFFEWRVRWVFLGGWMEDNVTLTNLKNAHCTRVEFKEKEWNLGSCCIDWIAEEYEEWGQDYLSCHPCCKVNELDVCTRLSHDVDHRQLAFAFHKIKKIK